MGGRYVGDNTESAVNLSDPPIVCAIYTAKPLPPAAWAIVGRLAREVSDSAATLRKMIGPPPPARPAKAAEK